MDELKSIAIVGGSDIFAAGTYKISDGTLPHPIKAITAYSGLTVTSMRHRLPSVVNKTSTITVTGTSGTAYVSIGADKLLLTFATNLYATVVAFVSSFAAKFAGMGITLTNGGTAQVETITLTGTSGTANGAAAGGLTKLATFDTDLATTAANFVTAHAAAYLAVNIVVTSDGADLVFTSSTAGLAFTAPTIANATGDLAGTVAHTTASATTLVFNSTRVLFPTPTIANATGDLAGTVATTGADGLVASTQTFLGDALNDNIDLFMEYPVEEIVIGAGSAILHFIK